jgi:hypothetical protein
MLDRYGEYTPSPEERAADIAACGLCDHDGYRNARVCDHVDRAESARRGMALIRAKMGWGA